MKPRYRKQVLDLLNFLLSPDKEVVKLGISYLLQQPIISNLNKHYEFKKHKVFTETSSSWNKKVVPAHLSPYISDKWDNKITKKTLIKMDDFTDPYEIAYRIINWILYQGMHVRCRDFNRTTPNQTYKFRYVMKYKKNFRDWRPTKNYMRHWEESWLENKSTYCNSRLRWYRRNKRCLREKHGHRKRRW